MSLPIVHFNQPVLREKGAPISNFDASLSDLAQKMVATMYEAEGIGLAAQQVGRALQLCVMDLRETDRDFEWKLDGSQPPLELFMPLALLNPEITAASEETTGYEEGCLSFPGIRGNVLRPHSITVRYHDLQGHPHELSCTGLLARCVQHEVDHLNGVLFIDRMDKKTLAGLDRKLSDLKRQTRAAAKA